MNRAQKARVPAYRWFLAAVILFLLFLLCTALYAAGVFHTPVLRLEQQWLLRPATRIDCLFWEWRRAGVFPVSLLFTVLLGGLCWLLGYRKRVVILLVFLLAVAMGFEVAGKLAFEFTMPSALRSGLTTLACPQMYGQPKIVEVKTALGFWNEIPAPIAEKASWARDVAQMPLPMDDLSKLPPEDITGESGYPSGHALRWMFLGLIACWLCWKHLRVPVLRELLAGCFLFLAFFGGFMQFYIGNHVLTDTLAGYLLGAAAACAAIGGLLLWRRPAKV
ncbi:PAP2 superfamily protein [Thermosporothrix hazakensis]|jgi:membrane-associated phospholipid phosphatase|uniref:PAP2 superfamily protein n=1 Tax=Thermosporothrix hazakensis TaxID=644383 RepID=A0A326UC18_THEHA|nr:phosphatase PAP2 family protein [Thermosporothrix hazakensis]PZW35928.1 PAP2 superfamily protein [Thermosporothrix hazakensis]GCE46582.1 hypothetical protein KTH_14510 [Thermosporothrix hazakensis]